MKIKILFFAIVFCCTYQNTPENTFKIFNIDTRNSNSYLIKIENGLDISMWVKFTFNNDIQLSNFIHANNIKPNSQKIYLYDYSQKITWWNIESSNNYLYYETENDYSKISYIINSNSKEIFIHAITW